MQSKDANRTAFGAVANLGYFIAAICLAILFLLRILYREYGFDHIYRYYVVSMMFMACAAIIATLTIYSIDDQCDYCRKRQAKIGPFLYGLYKVIFAPFLCAYIFIVYKVGFTIIIDEFFDEVSIRGLITLCVFVTLLPILLVPYICDFMPAKKNDISDI